ncbi:hypothetical protein ACIA8O_08585 [Kitasatospora sp. NPDC051853]|uniref:hypothetical protein n=1 Tax=Kitasatospora sp. NPDC051853 TaxID=3364058 RepID=UPI0037BB80AE
MSSTDLPEAPQAATGPPVEGALAETLAAGVPDELTALRQRVAELEQYKAERDREDLITDLARRTPYVTPEILRAFKDHPAENLEELAHTLSAAIHASKPTGLGSGGLTPSGLAPATQWSSAFSRAREERKAGRGSTAFVGHIQPPTR